MRDFDDFDAMRRRHERWFSRITFVVIAMLVLSAIGTIWLLTHPEAIGGFAGRIVAGFIAQ